MVNLGVKPNAGLSKAVINLPCETLDPPLIDVVAADVKANELQDFIA